MTAYLHALDASGNLVPLQVGSDGGLKIAGDIALGAGTEAIGKLTALPGLDIPAHDYIALSYTGSDLTGVTYKTGGSGGTTVATLTLAYTNSVLTSVTKS
jgi:hypothetical protein